MAEELSWVVTLGGDRPLAEVRRDLAAAGFRVDQVLAEIGVITGRCDAAAAARLRGIKGVADVSGETPIGIGPPDAPDTW